MLTPILCIIAYLVIGWILAVIDEYFDLGAGSSVIVIYPVIIALCIIYGFTKILMWIGEMVSLSPKIIADKIRKIRSAKN